MNKKKTTTTKKVVENKKTEETIDITAAAKQDEQSLPAAGLGDTIKLITNAIGIPTCTKCEERRKNLNRMFPFLAKQMQPLKDEDEELMLRVRKTPQSVANDDVNALFALYNKIYSPQRPLKRCQCPGLLRTIVERLELLMTQD
jgi:hypothetical protein